MYYEEKGTGHVSVYQPLMMDYPLVLNTALEMYLARMVRDMIVVDEFGGNALTFDIPYYFSYYTVNDIVTIFTQSGYKVVITACTSLYNKARITILWNQHALPYCILN